MTDFFSFNTYVATLIAVTVSGFLSYIIKKIADRKINKALLSLELKKIEQDILNKSQKDLTSLMIMQIYDESIRQGYIGRDYLIKLDTILEDYKKLGGNGTTENLVKRLRELPNEKQKIKKVVNK